MDKASLSKLRQSALDAAWIQWRSLGTFIDSDRLARSLIDPEALLMISLTLRDDERRLWDIINSWARNGSKLLSVQRVKNMRKNFPDVTIDRLGEFASIAVKEGRDYRWRNISGNGMGPSARSQTLWVQYPASWEASALLLRLRLGFGVGIVSDLVGFLISQNGSWTSAKIITKAINFSVYSIRRAADSMAAGQFIERTRTKPVQYRVKTDAWRKFLDLDRDELRWRFWYQVYSFVATIIALSESERWADKSRYLMSSELRDLAEIYSDAFVMNQIEIPDPRKFPGESYLAAFNDSILNLTIWINENV